MPDRQCGATDAAQTHVAHLLGFAGLKEVGATVRERIRPLFWGDPKARYEASFSARNFAARYNFLTCMENYARLLARQLGREGTTEVESPEKWRPFLRMNVDWDERNWHREDAAAPPPEPPEPPEKEEIWEQTPFGYWVPAE